MITRAQAAPETGTDTAQRADALEDVPDIVIQRTLKYVRQLSLLESRGVEVVNSEQLGAMLQASPAIIRRDLSYFGHLGRQNRGYDTGYVAAELRRILGLDHIWDAVLVGVGRLGRAVAVYPGFAAAGIRIVGAFDVDPDVLGLPVGNLTVQPFSALPATVRARTVDIGIVAVPAAHTQGVVDELARVGIRAILNYAPVAAQVPPGVHFRSIEPVLALQSMTCHLAH